MKGDFSRFIYDEQKNYSLVLMQQGRVQLDSDWNEQALLQWLEMQTLTRDLIEEHGGPRNKLGFEIKLTETTGTAATSNFNIGEGRYYVQGIVCKNQAPVTYTEQEAFPFPGIPEKIESGNKYLIYLHVWLRHITSLEDEHIREVALGGPDTTTRIQTVWQVKALDIGEEEIPNLKQNYDRFIELLSSREIIKKTTGQLQAQAIKPTRQDQPCITSPENRYRGNENQLYRVEIHRAGTACDTNGSTPDDPCATFKWSRENGSVVFPILELNENKVTLEHLGRDERFGLKTGDWVEIVDDDYELQRRAEDLYKITAVDPGSREVTLSGTPDYGKDQSKHPLLRRWDHTGQVQHQGTIPLKEGEWIELEDGIQIQFVNAQNEESNESGDNKLSWYQSGSWWWIPARNITGDIEWPQENDQPSAQDAMDAGNHYAPLALLDQESGNITDYRRKFIQLWE